MKHNPRVPSSQKPALSPTLVTFTGLRSSGFGSSVQHDVFKTRDLRRSVVQHCSQLVEEDGHLRYVKENIVLARIRYVGSETLPDDAVPVWRVLLVKVTLNICCNVFFFYKLVKRLVHNLLDVRFHVFVDLANDPLDLSLITHLSLFELQFN